MSFSPPQIVLPYRPTQSLVTSGAYEGFQRTYGRSVLVELPVLDVTLPFKRLDGAGVDQTPAFTPIGHLPYRQLKYGEIRLLLLQPGQEHDPIRLSLVHSHLVYCRNEFTALSYTWGDANSMHPIKCNDEGETISLTRNCENAIRRLRSPMRQETYWIDAICINQSELREREQQVSKMGEIFKSAAEVVIYLGEEEDGSNVAMDFLGSLTEYQDRSDPLFSRPLRVDVIVALRALFYRPWFNRVWVLQEVHNAKRVRLRCGTKEIAWSGILLYKWWHYLGRRDFDAWPLVSSMKDRSRYEPSDFLKLLIQARKSAATDPRDKVYALLPMIREDKIKLLSPDYTLSKEAVYSSTAVHLARFGPDFLCAVSHHPGTLDGIAVPSWVRRWDEDSDTMPIWPDTGRTVEEEGVEFTHYGDIMHSPYRINSIELYRAGGEEFLERGHSHQVLPLSATRSLRLQIQATRIALIAEMSEPIVVDGKASTWSFAAFESSWRALQPAQRHPRYNDYMGLRWAEHPLHHTIGAALAHRMWQPFDTSQ